MSAIWDARPNKQTVSIYIQKFYDVVDQIISFYQAETITLSDLQSMLANLQDGCQSMTENHCRKLWNKGRELGEDDINVICEDCEFYPVCLQNTSNQQSGKLYFCIQKFWRLIDKRVRDNIELTTNDIDAIKLLIKNMYDCRSEVNTFKNIIKNWDK